jgi:hypothetical protein
MVEVLETLFLRERNEQTQKKSGYIQNSKSSIQTTNTWDITSNIKHTLRWHITSNNKYTIGTTYEQA